MMNLLTLGAGGGGSAVQLDLLIVLACAGIITLMLSRLRVAAIPAYLLAGIAIGPSGLGLVHSPERIEQVGQLALIVLMFSIGMHLDSSSLRKGAASIISIGFLSTIGTAIAFWGILTLAGMPGRGALAAGMGLSMSSTAVVLRLLAQRRELQSTVGRVALGILLVQDLIVIAYLAVLPMLAAGAGVPDGEEPATWIDRVGGVMLAIGAIAAMIVLGRLVLPRVLREASRIAGGEVMLVLTAAVGLGAATLTAVLGLSPELGAFIAGFLLAGTPFRYQLAGQLAPVRDLFMAVFFTTVGLQVNLDAVMPVWWIVPLGTAGLMLIKLFVIGGIAWAVGAEGGLSSRVGASLAQAGEFSLVVFSLANQLDLISPDHGSVLVAVVIASLILTPAMLSLGPKLSPLVRAMGNPPWRRDPSISDDTGAQVGTGASVIIAGFGPVGRACVDRLEQAGVVPLIVELNPSTVREQKALGRRVIFGDVANPDVLESAGIEHAEAVVLTLPDSNATMEAVRTIRAVRPDIHIAVRVGVQRRADTARRLGADLVVVEEEVSAAALADQVLNSCELPERNDAMFSSIEGLTQLGNTQVTQVQQSPMPEDPDSETNEGTIRF